MTTLNKMWYIMKSNPKLLLKIKLLYSDNLLTFIKVFILHWIFYTRYSKVGFLSWYKPANLQEMLCLANLLFWAHLSPLVWFLWCQKQSWFTQLMQVYLLVTINCVKFSSIESQPKKVLVVVVVVAVVVLFVIIYCESQKL